MQELLYTSPTPIIHDKYQDISHDMVNKMNKILRDIVLKRGHLITYIYYEREIQNYFDNIYYQNKNEDQICTMIYNTIVQYINELIELTGLKDISKLITVDELKDINIPLDNLLKLNIKDDETNIDKLKEIAGIINNYAPNINHIINYIKISNQIRKEISYFKLYSESLATSGVSKLSTSLLKKQKDEYNSELLSLSDRYQDAKSLSENKYNRQLLLLDIEKNKILKSKNIAQNKILIKSKNIEQNKISYFKLYSESLATSGVSKLSTSLLKKQQEEYNSELLSLSDRYKEKLSLLEDKYNKQLFLLDIEKEEILKRKNIEQDQILKDYTKNKEEIETWIKQRILSTCPQVIKDFIENLKIVLKILKYFKSIIDKNIINPQHTLENGKLLFLMIRIFTSISDVYRINIAPFFFFFFSDYRSDKCYFLIRFDERFY